MHRPTRARPLLAVAAISVAACGSTAVSSPIAADPATVPLPAAAASAALPTPTSTAGAVVPPAASPRLMPDGRPACGNVAMRAPPCDAK